MELLNDEDVRVLGSLAEKELTTPENYPLSLNALTNACNQQSNRDPVVKYDEATVKAAVDRLRKYSLVRSIQRVDARVMKYMHLMSDALNLDRPEIATMCVLMLRGPQTVGEIRTRTARLWAALGADAQMKEGTTDRGRGRALNRSSTQAPVIPKAKDEKGG